MIMILEFFQAYRLFISEGAPRNCPTLPPYAFAELPEDPESFDFLSKIYGRDFSCMLQMDNIPFKNRISTEKSVRPRDLGVAFKFIYSTRLSEVAQFDLDFAEFAAV